MADNSMLIKVGLFGAAGYLAWRQGWLSFLGIGGSSSSSTAAGTPAGTGNPATPPPAPPPAPPQNPPAPSVLDGIFQRISSSAGSTSKMDADNWGWYLNNELAALGKGAAPDPVPLFGQRPFTAISLAEWWGPMSAALRSQMGLSGLGVYGSAIHGLAGLMSRYRRVA